MFLAHSNPYAYGYSYTHGYPNASTADRDAHTYAGASDRYTHTYGDRYTYPYGDRYTYPYGDRYTYPYGDRYANASTNADSHADTDAEADCDSHADPQPDRELGNLGGTQGGIRRFIAAHRPPRAEPSRCAPCGLPARGRARSAGGVRDMDAPIPAAPSANRFSSSVAASVLCR